MPVSWRLAEGYVFLESAESATLEEWKAAVDEALADPGFRPRLALAHDLRRMVRVPSAFEAMERVRFLANRSKRFGISRWAIVVSGATHYGMGRMAEILSEIGQEADFRAFKELEEAVAWARGGIDEGGNVA
jgi:hypothetical protein